MESVGEQKHSNIPMPTFQIKLNEIAGIFQSIIFKIINNTSDII